MSHQTQAPPRARRANLNDPRLAEYLPFVRLVAHKLHRRFPGVCVDDLVQEGVFGLAQALASYDPARGAALTSYAQQRTEGAMLDALRRHGGPASRRRRPLPRPGGEPPLAPEVLAGRRDSVRLVLRQLTRPERLLVILYYFEHLTMDEIAQVLGVSQPTISNRHTAILAKCRRYLTPHSDFKED